MKINFERERLLGVIDAVVRKTMSMDLTWDWPCGVAYYGVCEACALTGNEERGKEYLTLLRNRVDEYIELGLPGWTVNTCAMGHVLLTLADAAGEARYRDIAAEKLDYLRNKALRFGDGVLQHTVSAKNDFPEQAWADTLFMAGFFMLRAGVAWDDTELVNDALRQYYWHIKYLHDQEAGLWYHGYDNMAGDHMSGFYWGRANAWAAYTMAQVKRRLPQAYLYPEYMDIDCALRDQLSALKPLQTANGLWRTILDDPEAYEEVSASCGIAAAMLINDNPLHTGYVNRAIAGILENISDDGRVLNVSGGTAVMRTKEDYRKIPRTWTQGWGQGLALALLTAAAGSAEL